MFYTAQLALSTATFAFDKPYSYIISERLKGKAVKGARAIVPFGRANKRTVALILSVNRSEQLSEDIELKEIISVIDSSPLIGEEMLEMIFWLKETTFCTYFDAFRAVVPSGFSVRLKESYSLANVEFDKADFTEAELELIDKLKLAENQKEIDNLLLPKNISESEKKRLKALTASLLDKGVLELNDLVKRGIGDKSELNAQLTERYLSGGFTEKLSAKQLAVVKNLEQFGSASVEELCYMTGCTKAVVKRLEQKQAVRLYKVEIMRKATADADKRLSVDDIELNEQQQSAFDGIMQLVKENKPAGALLYGVTGSGKTAVFFKLINEAIRSGKTALMMVPEISLTPQMVHNFKIYFGDEIALLHSSLSLGQRADEFKRIRSGEAKIVIGTRSAVFAPLENIGIIIMDEEGERTYKSDNPPRYHARDAAIRRCGYHNCVLVMASATPSIESFYYAKNGRFHLFEMPSRYNQTRLPEVEIVDMQIEEAECTGSLFSHKLAQAIREALDKKEQVLLLLNRRGFTTYVSCAGCREPISCPNCSIPLTYHKKNERLMCHYCGYSMAFPKQCPQCGSDKLRQSGVGTQKIEDELSGLYPDARLLRMDADTTFSRCSYEESFSAFENHEYDIMLGTQMIAKGLNFPDVTLVGVVSVDKALFTGDYRSYERTFSLITQVAGRSGRGEKAGKAFIQTFVPDHYVINLAAQQNYTEFYEQESALRKALLYPPFCDICAVNFSSVMESRAIEASNEFAKLLQRHVNDNKLHIPLKLLGPSQCTFGRINNRYRYRLLLKCRVSKQFREMISSCMTKFLKNRKFSEVRINADVNGDIGL